MPTSHGTADVKTFVTWQGSTSGREKEGGLKECYVKWKGKSYMHCSWVPHQEIQSAAQLSGMPSAAKTKLRKALAEADASKFMASIFPLASAYF